MALQTVAIVQSSYKMHILKDTKNGYHSGRLRHRSEVPRMLGLPSVYAARGVKASLTSL